MVPAVHIFHSIAANTNVGGLVILQERFHQSSCLEPVAGQVYAHTGDGRNSGNVLRRVVCHA